MDTKIDNLADDLKSAINANKIIDGYKKITEWEDGRIETYPDSISIPPQRVSGAWRSCLVDMADYDYAIISANGGGAYGLLYMWASRSGVIKKKANVNIEANNLVISKPSTECKYLIINDKSQIQKDCYIAKNIYIKRTDIIFESGLVESAFGTTIQNAKSPSDSNARMTSPLFVGDKKSITITPKIGFMIGARCFDASGKLVYSLTKQINSFTLNCKDNFYFFIWIFGSYNPGGIGLNAEGIIDVANGFTISMEPLNEVDFHKFEKVSIVKWTNGYYIVLNESTATHNYNNTSNNYRFSWNSIDPGDIIIINTSGGKTSRAYAILDKEQRIIQVADEYSTLSNKVIIAPQNAAYLVLNDSLKLFDSYICRSIDKNTSHVLNCLKNHDYLKNNIKNRFNIGLTYATQLDSVFEKVVADRDENTITFAMIADIHYSNSFNATNEITLLNILLNKCNCDFLINLGDITYDSASYTIDYWKNQADAQCPILFTLGNHDVGASAMCLYGFMYGRAGVDVFGAASSFNWYCDIKDIRFISVNAALSFSTDFIQPLLNNTTKKVVIFAHIPPIAELNYNNTSRTGMDDFISVLDNFSMNIIAYFHGHTHFDNIYLYNDKFPFISIASALPQKPSDSAAPSLGEPIAYEREIGTITEFCFDIVNLHSDTGTIKMFRLGVGSDRSYPVV